MAPDGEGARLRVSGLGIGTDVDPFWARKHPSSPHLHGRSLWWAFSQPGTEHKAGQRTRESKQRFPRNAKLYQEKILWSPPSYLPGPERVCTRWFCGWKKEKKKQPWERFNEYRPAYRGETKGQPKKNWAHWLLSQGLLLPVSKTNSSAAWREERAHASQHDLSPSPNNYN